MEVHEMVLKIFSYLDGGSILRCSAVCKLWNKACNNRELWLYKLAEEMNGDIENNLVIVKKLENQEIEKYRYSDPNKKTMCIEEFRKISIKRIYLSKRKKEYIYRQNHKSRKIKSMKPVFPQKKTDFIDFSEFSLVKN